MGTFKISEGNLKEVKVKTPQTLKRSYKQEFEIAQLMAQQERRRVNEFYETSYINFEYSKSI